MIIYHFGEIIKLIKRTTLRDKLLGFDGSYVPFALLTSPYRDRLRLKEEVKLDETYEITVPAWG